VIRTSYKPTKMHTPLDDHLHTPECNKIIQELGFCYLENSKFKQLFGACDKEYMAMRRCLKNERLERTRLHLEASKERNKKIQDKMAKMAKEGKSFAEHAREAHEKRQQ